MTKKNTTAKTTVTKTTYEPRPLPTRDPHDELNVIAAQLRVMREACWASDHKGKVHLLLDLHEGLDEVERRLTWAAEEIEAQRLSDRRSGAA